MEKNKITIDNYPIKTHQRYAQDQEDYEIKYVQEAALIPHHLEIASTTDPIQSKWDELFESLETLHPWATFAPPPEYALTRNRFFSFNLSPNFPWGSHTDDEEQEEETEDEEIVLHKKRIQEKKSTQPAALIERDRSTLFNLLDTIKLLNGFLREIQSRKLQYQKG